MLPAGITPPESSFQFPDDAIRSCNIVYIPLNPYTVPNLDKKVEIFIPTPIKIKAMIV